MDELLTKLGLDTFEPTSTDGGNTYDLFSSNKYQKLFETLDKDNSFDIDAKSVVVGDEENHIIFINDIYSIELKANFNKDTYIVIIKELERD